MRKVIAGAMAACFLSLGAAGAAEEDPAATAKAIQASCVKRGENPQVCACGVGLAYAKLEPKVFALVPRVEPLLDEKDQFKAVTQLLGLSASSGLSGSDLTTAYQTIRANRADIKKICKPIAAKPG